MGNFEKLSVLVIVVIIVMILVVALYTWTDNPDTASPAASPGGTEAALVEEPATPPAGSGTAIRNQSPRNDREKEDLMRRIFPVGDGRDWPLTKKPGSEGADKEDPVKPPTPAPTDVKPEPPSPGPAPAGAPAFVNYVVKERDTLGKIAQDLLGGSSKWPEIVKANPGLDPDRLTVGRTLKIPSKGSLAKVDGGSAPGGGAVASGSAKPGGTYRVGRGETLETICKKVYGDKTRWPELWVANLALLDDPSELRQDMTLQLPR